MVSFNTLPGGSLLPALATAFFLAFATGRIFRNASSSKSRWMVPASFSLAFALFSIQAIVNEGMFGFWTEHARNLWGHQIWFDLLLAIAVAWCLIVPQAKAKGMRLLPWLILIVCTGCIGLLAMLARLLYLQDQAVS
jgi:hypothetical protein